MKRSDGIEIDGVAWCIGHGSAWYEGEPWCRGACMDRLIVCVEAPLFHGPAITGVTL